MKYLLWAVLLYLAWRWFSASRARGAGQDPEGAPKGDQPSFREGERMVECTDCGLHLPLSEALPGPDERFFCSEAHRDKHRSA